MGALGAWSLRVAVTGDDAPTAGSAICAGATAIVSTGAAVGGATAPGARDERPPPLHAVAESNTKSAAALCRYEIRFISETPLAPHC